jgi:hypothetical protein
VGLGAAPREAILHNEMPVMVRQTRIRRMYQVISIEQLPSWKFV